MAARLMAAFLGSAADMGSKHDVPHRQQCGMHVGLVIKDIKRRAGQMPGPKGFNEGRFIYNSTA